MCMVGAQENPVYGIKVRSQFALVTFFLLVLAEPVIFSKVIFSPLVWQHRIPMPFRYRPPSYLGLWTNPQDV